MKWIYSMFYIVLCIFNSTCFSFEKQDAIANNNTICITGGAGFIGGNFLKYMFDKYPGYQFIVIDALTYSSKIENIPEYIRSSDRFEFIHKSICDKSCIDDIFSRSDFVVHFAAETDVTRSIYNDEVFYETNVMGTRNLMHYLVKHQDKIKRFIHISSSEVYGTCEQDEIDEDHPLKPMSPYAASKAGADRLVYAYGCTYQVPVTILRFFNNYGPGQHIEKLVGKYIVSALQGLPLNVHGSGKQERDWIYVIDTARAIDAALHLSNFDRIKNEVINCGTGIATSVLDIAHSILKACNLSTERLVFTADRPGQVSKHLSSTTKAKALLGWEPITSLEEGLSLTLAWYQAHPEFWQSMLKDAALYKDNATLIAEKKIKNDE